MAEGVLEKAERKTEHGILGLMAYYAVHRLPIGEDEINSYIGIKTGHLAIKEALREMVAAGKIEEDSDGYYRLASHSYHGRAEVMRRQERLLTKAKWWGRLFGLLPFVKAVVVINSTAIGNVRADSDIDLFIITKPNRIYITKGILMYGLRLLRQLETAKHKAGRFSLGMYASTAGVNWQRDIMLINEPDLGYRLMLTKPVYGAAVWYDMLKQSSYLQEAFPNYVWPRSQIRVYGGGMAWLDQLDNKGYRKHLKHTAGQPKMHTKAAFIRVRPDILNLHALDQTGRIAREYKRIHKSIDIDA